MAREPYRRGRKLCIFCGNPANSGEHVWPKWSHELLPPMTGHTQVALQGAVSRTIKSIIRNRSRQGSVAKVKIKCVCKNCNNGWMSEYESALKPTLRAMMRGPRLVLGTELQRLLVEYFTFKIMVLDCANDAPVISQKHRTSFYEERAIPPNFQMRLAHCSERHMQSHYRTHYVQAVDPRDAEKIIFGKPNIKSFTIGFGGICILALYSGEHSAKLEMIPRPFWLQFFPFTSTMYHWPPLLSVSRAEVEAVGSGLEQIKIAKNVKVFDTEKDWPLRAT